ncbi:hypothetical protein, partial [Nocardioides sp. YIM 152588]|uniref:hypothetical protein n=1 Tax=Nocardioides sp. YIM 152588 TaxID=3158259 RepID=UPI0032E45357
VRPGGRRGAEPDRRRALSRSGAPLWGAGAVAAVVMVVGVNGSLASWIQAEVANGTNSVASRTAVILKQDAQGSCSSGEQASNQNSTCTNDLFGSLVLSPLDASAKTYDVKFTNIGSAGGTSFTLTPVSCTTQPVAGFTPTYTAPSLCTATAAAGSTPAVYGVQVRMNCASGGTSYGDSTPWSDTAWNPGPDTFRTLDSFGTRTYTNTGHLAAGATWWCRFWLKLDANESPYAQNLAVTETFRWTLATT